MSYTNLIRFLKDTKMAKSSGMTSKIQVTVDVATDRLVGKIAELGFLGTSKSEVVCSVLRDWLWDNQEQLRQNGIQMSSNGERSG